MNAEAKLAELGINLPKPPQPGGNYLTHRRSGNTLYLAGVISFSSSGEEWTGQVGAERSLEDGYAAARICALNVLATIREITGSLDSVSQFLYVGGYVSAIPAYGKSPSVINGASDLFESVFGEAGK
ncbi:MAG: RidA family protein, partial [Verrucomicrobiota bacterium]